MQNLIQYLTAFNSKERFFLAGQILGNPKFTITSLFREKLNNMLNISIPEDAFSAMDYHLDWIYAALNLAKDGNVNKIYSNADGVIKAQQEDIDWLIAFKNQEVFHLVLIEAKGVGGWTNKQLKSKANRFEQIFGNIGHKWPGVKPHFILMSPKQSFGLITSEWPQWMAPEGSVKWIELTIPRDLISVTRCTSPGQKSENGEYWTIEFRKNPLKSSGKKTSSASPTIKVQGLAGVKSLIGKSVFIGFTGGINALINSDLSYLKNRPFKWLDKIGSGKTRRNWIPINDFVREIRRMGYDW